MLDAWMRIDADGGATVFTGKVELGQGIVTALAQIAAEELDLPLARVKMISGDTGRTPNEGQTAGSQSIEASGTALRMAGAEARAILVDLAAKRLAVAADTLTVADGVISGRDGRKVGYGELAGEADLHREATAKTAPKPPAEHKIVGKPIPRLDIPAKVTGGVAYVQDMRLAGMLHGRVVRPPRYGAKLDGADEAAAKAMPGVVAVVRDGSFLGVVAAREEQAIAARAALIKSARWTLGPALPDPATIHEHLLSLPAEATVISDKRAPALANVPAGAQVMEATYRKPYMSHGSIGPSCALAELKDGKVTVWTHSQGVFPNRARLAEALGMNVAEVRAIHAEGSGCYGHNGADDVALDAALLARAVRGKPVRVQWMRDDEFGWEPYGAAMVMKAKATLHEGRIVDWSYDVWSNTHSTRPSEAGGVNLLAAWYLADPKKPAPPHSIPQPAGGGDRNAVPLYDFPRQRVVNHLIKEMPLRVSALRTLGAYANVFALEILHGRARARGRRRSGRLPARASDRSARPRRRRGGREEGRLDAGPEGRRGPRPRHRLRQIQELGELRRDRCRHRGRPERGRRARAARVRGGRCRADHQSGRAHQPGRGRHDPVDQLDAQGGGAFHAGRDRVARLGNLPDPDDAGGSPHRDRADRPAGRALARRRRGAQGPMVAAIANAFAHATGRRLRDLPLHRPASKRRWRRGAIRAVRALAAAPSCRQCTIRPTRSA